MEGSLGKVAVNLGGSTLWVPYKDLYSIVDAAVYRKDPDAIPDLEAALRRHRPDFISLLKNPDQSPLHRDAVRRASSEGIRVAGRTGMQILPQSVVDEALIFSDMFSLNELASLELLIAGDQQRPHYPGLTRGVVAVLLYYDGRRCLVNALRALVQARDGRTWTLGLGAELATIVTRYTDRLKEEGLISRVIKLTEEIQLARELDKLQKNRALGDPRYRKQVVDIIREIQQSLAEVVFCWACQSTMNKEEIMRLVSHLSRQDVNTGDGTADTVSLTLLLALLYAISVGPLQTCEETDKVLQQLPIIKDPHLVAVLHKELVIVNNVWHTPGMKAIVQFAWAITLRTLSQYPFIGEDAAEYVEEDERTVDVAIEAGAFHALQNLVVSSPIFHQEEFFVKHIHALITDYIVLMPLKVKDLRNKGDETARIIAAHKHEGLEPPLGLHRHFEHLLSLISALYGKDPLKLELSLEYWCPSDASVDQTHLQRPSARQVALFKFVRLAGDLLPPPLFVPYVSVLISLSKIRSGARHCFNLLKMNGGQCNLISWDHFFLSLNQYYMNLRQEIPVTADTQYVYHQRSASRGISPQELEGLIAVLQLVETVAGQDELARISLCENLQYAPLHLLVGLVGCAIPSELKAAMLRVLAACALSPEIAANIWQTLEVAQVIPVMRTISLYQPTGVLMELEEVESRNEEFPITRAMLVLLLALTDHPLPSTLGLAHDRPGFAPYLSYVRDSVFLKFASRAYRSESEKYEVASLCLKLIKKLLKGYRVSPSDFDGYVMGLSSPLATPPGFSVLVQLLQDTPFLHMVLLILEEGTQTLDQFANVPGQIELEQCTLLCLQLLHEALQRQDEFRQHVRNSNTDLMVTGLDQLLTGVNPRTGRADYLVVIAKYVTYNFFLPEHTLAAVSILSLLCLNGQVAQQLVGFFTAEQKEKEILLHGFVECLEAEDSEEPLGLESKETEAGGTSFRSTASQEVLKLILTCLKHPAPNLSHFLLGFQLRQPVSQTTLQDPGVLGSPRTCLHAIISLLDHDTDAHGYPVCCYDTPALAELCYRVIYALAANGDTCGPLLRYLRSSSDFLYRHLRFLPLKPKGKVSLSALLMPQAWLLKAVTVELRITTLQHQRSNVQRLLKALIEDTVTLGSGMDGLSDSSAFLETTLMSQSLHTRAVTGQVRRRLMRILDVLDQSQVWPSMPSWEYFNAQEVERLMKLCEVRIEGCSPKVNLVELHRRITDELTSLQTITPLGQQSLVKQEVRNVLLFAEKRNVAYEVAFAKRQIFEAWRQVAEVIFTTSPMDAFGPNQRYRIILEICQELLHKVLVEDALFELMAPASGVLLTLTAALSHSRTTTLAIRSPPSESPSRSQTFASIALEASTSLTHLSTHLVVLRGVIECLMKTGSGLQRVRANYYGALLNLLMIVQKRNQETIHSGGRILTLLEEESEAEKLRREHTDALLAYGDSLMEVVCRDTCSGHDITKMLALATLDVVMSLDGQQRWQEFFVSKGYLRYFIDGIPKDDEDIGRLLTGGPQSAHVLFVYESKMATLIRLAGSVTGARALLENGIFKRLAECRALDLRPERALGRSSVRGPDMDGEPMSGYSTESFGQVLIPALRLAVAVATALGSNHKEVANQLACFVSAHMDVFASILRDRNYLASTKSPEELTAATAILSHAPLDSHENMPTDNTGIIEHRGNLGLLNHQLLSVLPRLVGRHSMARGCGPAGAAETPREHRERQQLRVEILQVVANILTCCCSKVARSGRDAKMCRVLFSPSLKDTTSIDSYYSQSRDRWAHAVSSSHPPALGLLVTILRQSCTELQVAADSQKTWQQHSEAIPDLSSDELAQLLPPEARRESIPIHTQREIARKQLHLILQLHSREVDLQSYIIESILFLLWRHLEFFLLYCVPEDSILHTPQSMSSRSVRRLRNLKDFQESSPSPNQMPEASNFLVAGIGLHITQNELDTLKSDVQAVIGEQLYHKITSAQQHMPKGRTHVNFIDIILHRIKRLVKLHAHSHTPAR